MMISIGDFALMAIAHPPRKLTTYRPTHINDPVDPLVVGAANRKLWVNIVFLSALAIWLGTEVFAYLNNFSHVLDKQIFGHLKYVYQPQSIIWPWGRALGIKHMAASTHALLVRDFAIAYSVVALGVAGSIVQGIRARKYYLDNPPPTKDYHGSARWATALDLGASGLLRPEHWASKLALKNKNKIAALRGKMQRTAMTPEQYRMTPGVFLGEWYDEKTKIREFLRDVADTHIGLYAPTRTGKGVGILTPALLTWSQSAVVNDPKGELFAQTSGYRKHVLKQRIYRFDPLCVDGTGACFNVLDFIRLRTDYEVADAQNAAMIICDPQGQGLDTGNDSDHWKKTSVAFLTGVILHVLYSREIPQDKKNLAGIDEFLADPRRSLAEMYELMETYEHDPGFERGWTTLDGVLTATCPAVSSAAADQRKRPEDEAGSVMSSMQSYFAIYRDPIVKLNTSHSTFSMEDLMYAKRAATLYLINNPNMMERIRPIIRLVINTIMTTFCGSINFDENNREIKPYKNKLLMVMDEFTSTLGKMSILANGIAFVAGYGIKLIIVVQDIAQLKGTYGDNDAKSITANLQTEIIFATKSEESADLFSKMLGSRTKRIETHSWEYGMFGRGHRKTISEQYSAMPLLEPAQIQAIPDTDMVVMVTGISPIYAKKFQYYDEGFLKKRLKPPVTVSDEISREKQAFMVRYHAELETAKLMANKRRERAMLQKAPSPAELVGEKMSRMLKSEAIMALDEHEPASVF
jgi:type IV secretion system protein VirD4